MAIPVYLWLTDDAGNSVKGLVDVKDREGSIEILELMHTVELPIDDLTGKITGTRFHGELAFRKEIDCSSPYLYKGITSGRNFKTAQFRYYRINHNGQEEEYFRTTLENARVTDIESFMLDIKDPQFQKQTHQEYVSLSYEKITWHYIDGNIIHSDSWQERGEA
ncbi:type VI secretion system tube protein TssD [Pseudescherichia sp.]|uniref:type VI secretion system tube protein TssD n=1 Tax=Pseudescherichia sp. TaxID=2055881 RepID=UPI0028A88446|nr:type VI secretion system tube protein TssD [Pseudescherichia sp.]